MLAALAVPAEAQSPTRFAASKVLLAGIHQEIGHLLTLYCGCPYARRGRSGGDVDREACGLAARKNETRSDRIEWEHVVPASWFGSHGTCWQSGHELCPGTKKNGKPVKGRTCCLKPGVDPEFRAAHNDPHNLFPAGGEVNGDRSNHPYGTVAGENRAYGTCDFEVGGTPNASGSLRGGCPHDSGRGPRLAPRRSAGCVGGRAGAADRGCDWAAQLLRNAVKRLADGGLARA